MSKIDDTLDAIGTAKGTLGDVLQAVSAAISEAQEAETLLIAVGAEASAEALAACRETLEAVTTTVSSVDATLDEAHAQAVAGKG